MKVTHRAPLLIALFAGALLLVAALTQRTAAAALASQVSPSGGCGTAWNFVPSPSAASADNSLAGVGGSSATDVWAAGFYTGTNGIAQTLIEHWNGTAWSLSNSANQGTADNYLQGVAAFDGSNAWAVGYYKNGANFSTLIEHWNGTNWQVVPSPNGGTGDNFLYGVAVVSAADAWAVGLNNANALTYRPIVLHWTGGAWNTVSVPTPGFGGGLRGITVVDAQHIWAVGAYAADLSLTLRTLAMHWNGTAWSQVSTPNSGSGNNALAAVAATSDTDAWAVGVASDGTRYQTLTEHLSGGSWTLVSSPTFGTGDNGLGGVITLGTSDVWAVGAYSTAGGSNTLALHWDGVSWTQGTSDNPGASGNQLLAASKVGTDMWAVGSYSSGAQGQTLTERYGAAPCTTPTATSTSIPGSTPTSTATSAATSTPTVTVTPCAMTFMDVQPTDYFYVPVRYLFCEGAISGYADNTFRPYNNTTRGQLSKIVVLAEGWPIDITGGPHFNDVPSGSAFYPYIETAYNRHVISGYADNTFRPGANVTRAQLSKIVVNAQGWTIDTTGGPHFTDVPVTDPFYGFIETAYNHGIISGYGDNTFRPGNNATRGQISKIVYNAVTGQ